MELPQTAHSSGRRLRALTFVHALADFAGCRHDATAIWGWLRPEWLTGGEPRYNHKVNGWLLGSTPHSTQREAIYRKAPCLRAVFENPLWSTLAEKPSSRDLWEMLAKEIKVGGEPWTPHVRSGKDILFRRVDWKILALLLILLGTQSPLYLLERKWLMLNFASMVSLVATQKPILHIHRELFDALTDFISRPPLAISMFRNWSMLADRHEAYMALSERLRELEWLDEDNDVQRALFLWMLMEQRGRADLLLNGMDGCSSPLHMPANIRRQWRRLTTNLYRKPLSLGEYYFDL